jgi:hypothetical protein
VGGQEGGRQSRRRRRECRSRRREERRAGDWGRGEGARSCVEEKGGRVKGGGGEKGKAHSLWV